MLADYHTLKDGSMNNLKICTRLLVLVGILSVLLDIEKPMSGADMGLIAATIH